MKYTMRGNLPKQSDDYLRDVLLERGVEDPARYRKPTENDLLDPYLLDRVEEGVDLLAKHIARGSKFFIQIDADVDGFQSSAIFYNYIKLVAPEIEMVWRVHEGKQHGVIVDTVPEDCALVVVIDAGSNQREEFDELYARGHEVLCVDHHHTDNPPSQGVLVNNQLGNYPNKGLSGAGVLYKFLQVYDEKYIGEDIASSQLDLVAAALVADMMDLRHYETRYLVKRGLSEIRNLGLRALLEKQEFSIGDISNPTPEKIAWYIAPLINAIVRVGTQKEKETMFLAFVDGGRQLPSEKRGAKPGDFETQAGQTARVATNARNRQNKLKEQAIALMTQKVRKYGLDEHKVILITLNEEESEQVDSTLTGLVAMQLTKQYQRPVIVSRIDDGGEHFSGSLRGINDSALEDFRAFCEDSGLVRYAQGHANQAGISIVKENREAFLEYVDKHLASIDFTETFYEVDYEFVEGDDAVETILQLATGNEMWGQGLVTPIVAFKDIQVFEKDVSIMGKTKEHVKFSLCGVDCVKFFAKDLIAEIEGSGSFTITALGKPNLNEWQGRVSPQIFLDDYEVRVNMFDF